MSGDNIDIAIGVVNGQVITKWNDATNEIVFDPANAYKVGLALSRAAMQAHGNAKDVKSDTDFILGEQRITVTDAQRDYMVAQVATILKTFMEQGKSPGYMAMHCVDTVLAETAK